MTTPGWPVGPQERDRTGDRLVLQDGHEIVRGQTWHDAENNVVKYAASEACARSGRSGIRRT